MQRIWLVVLLILLTGFASPVAAVTFDMYNSFTNRDGVVTTEATGLFTPDLTWSTAFTTPGDHYFGLYIDVEIDEVLNTFANETGSAHGTPEAGQTWELDQRGFFNFSWYYGDIYWNAYDGILDNQVYYDAYDDWNNPEPYDDVAMALAWDFTLLEGDVASISFLLSDEAPTSGFYLSQFDPDSNATLYFSSTLDIQPIPEPSTLLLFGSTLAGLGFYLRKRRGR